MAELHFRVKTDVVLGGRICPPSAIRVDSAALEEGKPGDITSFYLSSWLGAGSQEFSVSPIAEDGTATVRLRVKPGDVDTIKFAVAFGMAAPKTTRCCHLASGFLPVGDLVEFLGAAGRGSAFTAAQSCLVFKDNFTSNQAALRFSDVASDLPGVRRLGLRASTLRELDATNEAVCRLGEALKGKIGRCAVSPLNAGVQFVESFTFGHMSQHMTHYALLGYLFDNLGSPVDLKMVMYDAYQTMHSTDLGFDALRKMPDAELALRFGVPLITRHTSCALSNVYCTDYTVNGVGQTCKLRETEDIARSFSALNMGVQAGLDHSTYPNVGQRLGDVGLARAMDELDRAGVTRHTKEPAAMRRTSRSTISDDCENLASAALMKARGIRNVFEAADRAAGMQASAAGAWRGAGGAGRKLSREQHCASSLAAQMSREGRASPLFAACTDAHHAAMAAVLCRLGAMLRSGEWENSFLVASAKSASYVVGDQECGGALSGHGAGITRVRDAATGLYTHAAIEGTTYATVDRPMPEGYPSEVPVKLLGQNGGPDTVEVMGLEMLATAVGQNIDMELGFSPNKSVLAHFKCDYGDQQDKCPFYKSAFYTGLKLGGKGCVACAPVDMSPSPYYMAGDLPLFGAPVMALSRPSTMAIPVSADTLAAAGVADAEKVLKTMADQVEEAWGPMMTQAQKDSLMSYWQPVDSPDLPRLTGQDYATHVRVENAWAFDDPRHTALAVRVCAGLAERFNAIQAADPESDGARAVAFGQYLSATLRITLPVPRKTQGFTLTAMRNMRRAGREVGLTKLASCPIRARMLTARSRVRSEHLFYMCDRGEGPVHAYNKRIA